MRPFDPHHVPTSKTDLSGVVPNIVDLEIGCGVGRHSIEYAQKHPDRTLVALDRSRMRMGKFQKTLQQRAPLNNLHLVCEDADKFLVHGLRDIRLERVFFLYPNPYPKERQANKRWHRMPLMQFILRKMTPAARIVLATNKAFYASEAKAYFVQTWKMKLEHEHVYKDELPFAPRTHFEEKYLARGETLFDLTFVKSG